MPMFKFLSHIILGAALSGYAPLAFAQETAKEEVAKEEVAGSRALVAYDYAHHPVMSRGGMVSTQDKIATELDAISWPKAAMLWMQLWRQDLH